MRMRMMGWCVLEYEGRSRFERGNQETRREEMIVLYFW